jgi:drug/metabolite transporter (DMT)-like permease
LAAELTLWIVLTGAFWWAFLVAGLMWAAPKLDPTRVGILHMIEVPVAAASAALIVSEHLSPLEVLGGGLVVVAGLLEVWPVRRKRPKLTE